MNWNGEHRAFIVETFFKQNESITATQRTFRLHFKLKRHVLHPLVIQFYYGLQTLE